MGIPQPLWETHHLITLMESEFEKKKVLIICDWNFMCLSLSVASHHSAVHFGKESDSIYPISSVVMGFPLVAKAISSIWTKAELIVKAQAVFP